MIRKDQKSKIAVGIIFVLSLVSTFGSLYFSEVLGLIPCELCWFQRIFMYPILIISLFAFFRNKSKFSAEIILVLSFLGLIVSSYHSYLQRFPSDYQCGSQTKCSAILYTFHGLSIPNLALISFTAIFIISIYVLAKGGEIYNVDL